MDQPFTFALAKGARTLCSEAQERLVGSAADAALFDGDDASVATSRASALSEEAQLERRQRTFSMAQALSQGHWDGDRDSLADAPDARDWSLVAAERHTSCTVRHCPHFRGCSYYEARLRLADAERHRCQP